MTDIHWHQLPDSKIASIERIEVAAVGSRAAPEPIIVPQVPNLHKGNGRKH